MKEVPSEIIAHRMRTESMQYKTMFSIVFQINTEHEISVMLKYLLHHLFSAFTKLMHSRFMTLQLPANRNNL
jgi:hypothetical protein